MQAIILAAGMGKRLKELTQDNTKCMVKVNGVTLIDRMLHQLEHRHLSRIVIVVGYKGKKLMDYIATLNIQTPIIYVNNPIYDKTNNIYSLFLASEYLVKDDTLLLESDLIFDDAALDVLIDDPRETLALVDKYESWMDGTCLKLSSTDRIEAFISGKHLDFSDTNEYYKTINIYKFSRHFSETKYVPFLNAYSKALGNNEYYEQVLRVIMLLDEPEIRAKRLPNNRGGYIFWYEIDDVQDLDIASSIFAPTAEEKLTRIQNRYGGYWRYPHLIDFCYLVNPYFPPKKLVDEIKASTNRLITSYPSGMAINSLLASKNFGIHQENIIVGNGAAELIKLLLNEMHGITGIIKPTFNEYPNRYDADKLVTYTPTNNNFSYTADDLINYFSDKSIDNLILINVDIPTGNYIERTGLLKLIDWTKTHNIKLVVDESFIDFADETDTLIDQTILDDNRHVYVVKSISKSYGVAGLRLGVLASGDTELIDKLKKYAPIWNINSIAEFYMQIIEKYKSVYINSLKLIRAERERLANELSKIQGVRVIPSKANFIMVELTGSISSKKMTTILLSNYNMLVKDLSLKIADKNYLRLSVRDTQDNDKLLSAIKEILNNRTD